MLQENKFLFFDAMKNDQIFTSKVFHFLKRSQIPKMGNIRGCKEARLQKNLLNLVSYDSIRFGIF